MASTGGLPYRLRTERVRGSCGGLGLRSMDLGCRGGGSGRVVVWSGVEGGSEGGS